MKQTAYKHSPRVERDDLRAGLETVLARRFGVAQRITRLRRRASAYSSSSLIENLDVRLEDGQELHLVFKNLSPAYLLNDAQRIRPAFLYSPQREIEVYERLLEPARCGTAECYGSLVLAGEQRHWLFLERLKGKLLWQVGRLAAWQEAARWLAAFHARFEDDAASRQAASGSLLLRGDRGYYELWLERAERLVAKRSTRLSSAARRSFRRLVSRHDRLVTQMLELPVTVIHGEFYPSNIIVARTSAGLRICPVDWELTAVAPGLLDLAALTAGGWDPGARQRMVSAYRERRLALTGNCPSLVELVRGVELCQLHWCVKWLGWAAGWNPPAEHTRDWLAEALRLAKHLDL